MKTPAFASFGLLLVTACGGKLATPNDDPQPDAIAPAPNDAATALGAPEAGSLCSDDGDFGVSFIASGLAEFEGRHVWASGVHIAYGARNGEDEPVFFLETRVRDGHVDVACERGIVETYSYPRLALVIDANGDEHCSDGDLHMSDAFYGWANHLDYDLERHDFFWVDSALPGHQRICADFPPP